MYNVIEGKNNLESGIKLGSEENSNILCSLDGMFI